MNQSVLACKPREWLTEEQAATTKSVIDVCRQCGREVWVVPDNLVLLEAEGAVLLCLPCAVEAAARETAAGETAVFLPARPAARRHSTGSDQDDKPRR
jgi:hypothetical protein